MIPTVAREVGADENLHDSHLARTSKPPSQAGGLGLSVAGTSSAHGEGGKAQRKPSLLAAAAAPLPTVPLTTRSRFEHLLPPSWQHSVMDWFHEDVPVFDYGGFVVGETPQVGILYGKGKGVLAGVPFFEEVFRQCNCRVEWELEEGQYFEPIKVVAKVYGSARHLLMGERVALNMIARASGIATRCVGCYSSLGLDFRSCSPTHLRCHPRCI